MSTGRQRGYVVQERMMRMYHGKESNYESIDFFTKKYAIEVKSANLCNINRNNGNNRKGPHRKIVSSLRLGRFFIDRANHVMMKVLADEKALSAQYVFVLTVGAQGIKRVLSWEQVNTMIDPTKERTTLSIRHVWPEEFQ